MNKSVILLALVAIPLAAWAGDGKPTKAAKAPKPAASAPAYAASAIDSRTAVRASKTRGSDMGACRKQAADQGLHEVEAKQFIVTCLSGK